jgi:glucosyl-3-phosphoglycerate phosphatase
MASQLLFLVRHGESAWNAVQRLQGQADAPLSDLGREQARALRPVLATLPPAGLVTSDLSRAALTAELAGHPGAEPDPRWRERSMGDWTGELERDVPAADMDRFRHEGYVPPGGETWDALQHRVGDAIEDLSARGGHWLVFTHGGPVRAAVAHVTGADHRAVAGPANTSLTVLELAPKRRMLTFNWSAGDGGVPRASEPGGGGAIVVSAETPEA